MVEDLYADVRRELHKPARRSVLAHLVKLVDDGSVAVEGGSSPRLDSRYCALVTTLVCAGASSPLHTRSVSWQYFRTAVAEHFGRDHGDTHPGQACWRRERPRSQRSSNRSWTHCSVARTPVSFEFWDGSRIEGGSAGTMRLNTPDAVRRIIWSPDELGVSRAYVTGEIDAIGDTAEILRALQPAQRLDTSAKLSVAAAATRVVRSLGGVGTKPPVPAEEVVPRGVRHSLGRDRQVVSHHYDVGNDFYALVLGPAMTYSCARFVEADTTLEDAQTAKHELICRKLGLDADSTAGRVPPVGRRRLLDVGCGWASMALHAATNHDVDVVGITLSAEQAAHGRARVEQLGLADRIDIRIQDYREIDDGPFDAISSIGMAEHVGVKRMPEYFSRLYGLLRPGGRMLNHAISSVGGSRLGRRSFVGPLRVPRRRVARRRGHRAIHGGSRFRGS